MNTDLATATVDDLLSFLRSDAPVPKRAATDRAATDRPNCPNSDNSGARRPPTAVELAARRRPPMAATRYYADRGRYKTARDNHSAYRAEEHGDGLGRVECRIMAWLVCRCLGPQWRVEYAEERWGSHKIVHRATAATLCFKRLWNDRARYEISAEGIYRKLPSITVSAERTAADIAADIERRLIRKGLFDFNAERRQTERDGGDDETRERRRLLTVAKAYGGNLRHKRAWSSPSYPEATCEHFGHVWIDDVEGWKTSIKAECGYHGGIQLRINTADIDLAAKIAATVREHYN